MKSFLIKVIFISLIISVNFVKSQTFTNYTTSDGLPDNFICGGVAIDTNNNKWFGTAAGVAKFNDTSWTVFTTVDGLINNYIICIAVDINNNVWVGTDGYGVSKYNDNTWTSYTVADGLADNTICAISGDTDGDIWFGTYDHGITKLSGTTWTTYTYLDGLPGNVSATAAINFITNDASGNNWFATNMGLVKYDGVSFSTINQASAGDSLLSECFTTVSIDNNNNKWLGTLFFGMVQFNNIDNWVKNYTMADGLYNNYVQDIDFDSQGNLWIGLYASYINDGGITKFNGTEGTSYTVADGLVDAQVIRLAIDKNDIIWIATGDGVSKFTDFSAISESDRFHPIHIYPNPTNDIININLTDNEEKGFLVIYNQLGATIYQVNISSNKELKINVSNFQKGLYFIQISDGSKVFSEKFIIH